MKTCAECRYFHPETEINNSPAGTIGHSPALPSAPFHSGQCRVHAPKITAIVPQPDGKSWVGGGWPPTVSFNWCGEWNE